ncbi:MAG: class I SAM-dependent methyltransferase [Solirubrobacteraceae bacterium]
MKGISGSRGSRAGLRGLISRTARPEVGEASRPPMAIPPGLEWFWEKYDGATEQIVSFCEACGLSLGGLDIADVGCGEGSMALGLCHRVQPRRVIGFDTVVTNVGELLDRSTAIGVADALPAALEFRQSAPTTTPAATAEFDFVYSWSAFEHVADPIAVLEEIRRILRPTGHFFMQLWPFYLSAKGSHLWQWFDEDFHHLLANDRDVVAQVAASDQQPREWADYMSGEFERLNRITVAELQRAVLLAGFDVIRLELLSSPTMLPRTLARYSWTDLGISGVKLLAKAHR